MRTLIVFMFCLAFSPAFAEVEQAKETSEPVGTYLKIGVMDWTEYIQNKVFIQDRVMLVTAGMEGTLPVSKKLEISWLIEAYGGVGVYNGSMLLSKKPVKTVAVYLGIREEVALHMRTSNGDKFQAGSFLGLGHTLFAREPEAEIWNVVYARVGVETAFRISDTKVFVRYGAVLPIATMVYGSHLNIGYEDGFYFPRGRVSVFGELGCTLSDATKMSIAFDSLQLGRSTSVKSQQLFGGNTLSFFQPDSKSYTVWLKVSYHFGQSK